MIRFIIINKNYAYIIFYYITLYFCHVALKQAGTQTQTYIYFICKQITLRHIDWILLIRTADSYEKNK